MEKTSTICQSCSMPMSSANLFGTEKDGSPSKEYCVHCYQQGSFTKPHATLEELIELYAPQWGAWTNNPTLSLEDAKIAVRKALLPLKRWQQKSTRRCCCCD